MARLWQIGRCGMDVLFCIKPLLLLFLQSFSKPMICLSVATVVASAYKESRHEKPVVTGTAPAADLAITNIRTGEGKEEEILVTDQHDQQVLSLEVLKQELERNGVILTER